MVVYTLEQRWKVGLQSTYRRCRFWQKNNLFRWSLFWSWRVCKQTKLSHLWHRNTHTYIENPAQNESLFRGIIGPFFFENEQGEAVTINSDRYRTMLNEVLLTKIEEEDIGNIRFQQDDATCYTAEATLNVLRHVFEDCIISRRANDVWPSRSCDLIPLDYYLWGVVKDKCYADKSEELPL